MRFSQITARFLIVGFCLAVGVASATSQPAPAPPAQPSRPAAPAQRPRVPDATSMVVLVRSSIVAVDQAIKTGNFTVVRDMGSPQFQQLNTASKLSTIFAELASRTPDLSRVTVLDPQYSQEPVIDAKGMLHVAGLFPAGVSNIQFDILFQWSNGRWRYISLGVGLS